MPSGRTSVECERLHTRAWHCLHRLRVPARVPCSRPPPRRPVTHNTHNINHNTTRNTRIRDRFGQVRASSCKIRDAFANSRKFAQVRHSAR
eukprot:875371-Prymnesium_polylepis.1